MQDCEKSVVPPWKRRVYFKTRTGKESDIKTEDRKRKQAPEKNCASQN